MKKIILNFSDATFAEKFYSLKRISINSGILNANLKLTTKQRCWSVIFCVLFPYFKNKVKTMVENIENGEEYKNQVKYFYSISLHLIMFLLQLLEFLSLQIRISKKRKETFLMMYKSFHVITESLCIIYYLRYMTGRSETHSVSLRLAGVTLVYFHDKSQNSFGWKTILKEIYSGNWRFVH